MTIKNNIIIRAYCFYILVIIIGLLIIAKIVIIQLNDTSRSSVQYIEIESIPGNLYSSDNKILATTIASYDIRIDMNIGHIQNSDYNQIIEDVSTAIGSVINNADKNALKNRLQEARKLRNRYFLIKSAIGLEELQGLKNFNVFQKSNNKTGLMVVKKFKRIYPFSSMALRTIGYSTNNNMVGIEGAYNSYLTSESVKVPITRGLGGIVVPLDADYLGINKGSDITLTIDTKLQSILQEVLLNSLIANKAESGTAILMEVKTGKIKAISNFLQNIDNTYSEKFNLAVGSSIEPGSTFKLASIMAALEDKKFNINDSVNVENGSTKFYNHILRDVTKPQQENITIKEAFKYSSNVGIAKAIWNSYKNNPQQFINRLKQFHMASKLDLDIKGEGMPAIKTPQDSTWSKITLPWMSIGYEVLQTPLNILSLYNTVANNGTMVKPQFVEQIKNDDEIIQKFETIIIENKICSKQTIKQAKILLEEAGKLYTEKLGKSLYYSVAGKTGTAQIAILNKGYKVQGERIKYRASFAGYFPADNPEYSMVIMINAPRQAYYGAQVAFPIFQEIVNKIYMINTKDFKDIKHLTLNETYM